ncbi:Permease of the drug/metabolite transporter (DMT) superfamily [Pseudorhodobacter antarcticus]|uniref:Permease of the drug/metabolite transporter (DMT) superfamily n=2 Tax=Pseudorhodobacter antarcticus TaxID=1077947 RepID=A0A1H8KY94_9RHOB|nr:Permease of the drug/metabolite transporter (DMT) superfamily [Pseudorhodobacter antarcticus]
MAAAVVAAPNNAIGLPPQTAGQTALDNRAPTRHKSLMPEQNRPLAASLWMIGSIVAFLAMAVAGREVSATHDTFEIMTFRSLIGFVIVCAVSLALKRHHEIQTTRLPRHIFRNALHFTGQNLWFYALAVIPLGQVFALEFTSPIWVILLAPIFLGETLTRTKLVAAALGLTGTLIVARPDFAAFDPGIAAAALAALCFAGTNIATKALTRRESIVSIMFWLTGMQLIMGLVMAGYDGHITLPTTQTLPFLILIGLAGLTAHFCLTTALSLAPASVIIPVDFLRLPLAFAIGWLLYDEQLELAVILGAALILSAIILNLRANAGAAKRAALQQI